MKEIKQLLRKIAELAQEKEIEVYLAGGFIRDKILGKTAYDIDFVLEGDALAFSRYVAQKLNGHYVLLKENFGQARVILKDKSFQLDFSKCRGSSIYFDVSKRDFTVNSLVCKLDENEINFCRIIDVYGGINHLKKKLLREVSPYIIQDDPIRILRAVRLCATHRLSMSASLKNLIKKQAFLIKKTSVERIRDELFRIFLVSDSYIFIELLDNLNVLKFIIPEIEGMKGVDQSGYHHLDVWKHSLESLKQLEKIIKSKDSMFPKFKGNIKKYLESYVVKGRTREQLLKLAILLHDIAKPTTRQEHSDGKITFYYHDILGSKVAVKICQRLKLSRKETKIVQLFIAFHLRPGFFCDGKNITMRAMNRLFRSSNEEITGVLLLSLADRFAARGRKVTSDIIYQHKRAVLKLFNSYFNEFLEIKPKKLINGHDILKTFNLKPGPLIGKILKGVEEAQFAGEISAKEEALEYAKKMIKRIKN